MRSLRLTARLASRNLRHRPAQAALLLLTLTIATGALGVGMWLYGSADGPWDKVWTRTQGFHVQVDYYTDARAPHKSVNLSRSRSQAMSLARDPRVLAVGGPWIMLDGKLDVRRQTEGLTVQVRGPRVARVDQPLITAGRWLGRGGGIVLEDGLAHTLHARPGDTVLIDGHRFHVRGVAMTVSQGRFPLTRPALAWVTPQTAGVMRGIGMSQEGFQLEVRLANPADAPAVAAAYRALNKSTPTSTMFTQTWEAQKAASHSDLDVLVQALFSAGILIAILTIATAAVIIALIEGGDLPPVTVSAVSLALLAAAVPVAFAAIVSIPARLLARRSVAPLLTYE
jgi:putative ABC transport system permease protein